ncbi:hypothetical protein CTA2_11567 [Colletotrichum tanaceti]|nr:hypothetical protein CTA2_11567 [Colletotrichum tanaceti]
MPMPQVQQPTFPSPTGDPFLRWGGAADANGLVDGAGAQTINSYGMVPGPQQQQQQQQQQFVPPTPNPNNALARRQMNRALVPTGVRQNFDSPSDPWSLGGEDSALLQQQTNGTMTETDNIEVLEEMARKAMREAQQKRKQIPPFVQKLSRVFTAERPRVTWRVKVLPHTGGNKCSVHLSPGKGIVGVWCGRHELLLLLLLLLLRAGNHTVRVDGLSPGSIDEAICIRRSPPSQERVTGWAGECRLLHLRHRHGGR